MNDLTLNITVKVYNKDGGYVIEANSEYEDGSCMSRSHTLQGSDENQILRDNQQVAIKMIGNVIRNAVMPKPADGEFEFPA